MKRAMHARSSSRVHGLAWAFGAVGALASAGRLEAQCRNPNVFIPDNTLTGVSDTQVVATTGTVANLKVSLNITHTWVGDLIVILTHIDTGTNVTLLNRPGTPPPGAGCGSDNIIVTLDDAAMGAAQSACVLSPPAAAAIGGTLHPLNPLSAFNGESIMGSWGLNVTDKSAGDTGTFNQWCLIFAPPCAPDVQAPAVTAPADATVPQTLCN